MSEFQPPRPGPAPGVWAGPSVPDDLYGPATWNPIPQQDPPGALSPWDAPAAQPPLPVEWARPPAAPGPYAVVPGPPTAMPDGERTYPQMLRGPRRRWWKPLAALGLAALIAVGAQVLAFGPLMLFGLVVNGPDGLGTWLLNSMNNLAAGRVDAGGFFYTNLGLIALIPAAGLSIWAVHRIRPRFVSSVVGGLRWRWLVRCLVVVVPIWALYTVLSLLFDRPVADRPAEWVALLVIVVVMTPLQAAGEEYFFRGWILQNVGSWFSRPMVSLVVATIVSTVTFSAAHGSPDPWILGTLGIFAVSCCLLTWRTGGLEAAIAIHAVNNIAAFVAVINFGGWDEAFIGGDTKGDPVQFGIEAAMQVIAFALIWWQAKRVALPWTYRPAWVPAGSMLPGRIG